MWRCPFKLYFEALALTEKMNRLLLWTPVHLHRASFSTTKHNMCGRVLCKLQLQHLKNLADAWVSGQWCRCTISPEPGIWTKSQPSSQKPCPVNLLVSKCEISKPGLKLRKWSSQDGKVALARKPRLSHLLAAKFSNCSISSTLHNKARGQVLEKCENGCGANKREAKLEGCDLKPGAKWSIILRVARAPQIPEPFFLMKCACQCRKYNLNSNLWAIRKIVLVVLRKQHQTPCLKLVLCK